MTGPKRRTETTIAIGNDFDFAGIEGFTSDGHVIVSDFARRATTFRTLDLYECDPGTRRLVRKHVIRLPWEGEVGASALEHSGRRIVFTLMSQPAANRYTRLLKPINIDMTHLSVSLWISGLDGEGLRCLGAVPLESVAREDQDISDVKWLPDGKRVSFICHRSLWTIPAG